MKWIGFDIGIKWTGMAMTDELGIVEPKKTIKTEVLVPEIKKMKNKFDISGIVLGLPLTPKGKIGQRAKFVMNIKSNLEKILDIPIYLYDERFTTKEAIKIASEMNKPRDRKLIDRISATLILRGFLEEN